MYAGEEMRRREKLRFNFSNVLNFGKVKNLFAGNGKKYIPDDQRLSGYPSCN